MTSVDVRTCTAKAVVVGSVWGDFVVTDTYFVEGDPRVTVKCSLCGTEQCGIRHAYLAQKQRQTNYNRGCYNCYRDHRPKLSMSLEEAQRRRKAHWAKTAAKRKIKLATDPVYAKKYRASARNYEQGKPWAKNRLQHLKARAIRAGVPWDHDAHVGLEILPTECPVLGIPLFKGTGTLSMNSPSIDRKVPSLGYVKGNLQIISQLANGMKQNATPEQLLRFAEWVQRTYAK